VVRRFAARSHLSDAGYAAAMSAASKERFDYDRRVHLRAPSIDHGVISFVWALVLAVLLWVFMIGVGISKPTAFIVSAVAGCAIFLYVRLYGEDDARPRRSPR
jgi:hypothetical protein